jgi:exodeoxyribonuclease-1
MTRALRPDGITWPNYDDGTPCFQLTALTAANNLQHDMAHDALSDVYATIALARLIKEKQPKLFDYAFKLRDKRFVTAQLDALKHKPFLHISSRFSAVQGNAAIMLPLMAHPTNKNSILAFNLTAGPELLLTLSSDELAARVFVATVDLPAGVERIALKEIHLNKSPMVLPVAMLDDACAERLQLDKASSEQYWQQFMALTPGQWQLIYNTLTELYSAQHFAQKTDAEQLLYASFVGDEDKKLLPLVRKANVEMFKSDSFHFKDERLRELLFRYRARHFSASLSPQEQQRWQSFCARRLQDISAGASLTLEEFYARIDVLIANPECEEAKKVFLMQLRDYGDTVAAKFLV